MSDDSTSPSTSAEGPTKAKWYRNRWVIGVCAFLVGAAMFSGSGRSDAAVTSSVESDALKAQLETANTQIATLSTKLDEQTTQLAAAMPDPAATVPEAAPEAALATTFSDGTYLVGTDIPAGRYKGTVIGSSAYWQIAKDPNGDNILSNNNTEGSFYIQVKKGQFLEINGAEMTKVK